LGAIFDMCDLDGNGRLSMTELNLFTLITSNETISHKYWKFIEGNTSELFRFLNCFDRNWIFINFQDTVGLKKNELTKDAFISLYKMQASDRKDENYDDLYEILENMGFNKALKIDQVTFINNKIIDFLFKYSSCFGNEVCPVHYKRVK